MGIGKINFQSDSHDWPTPDALWEPLNREFGFTLDVAADASNAKCGKYFDASTDGLTQQWEGVCWMNPPFGRQMRRWVIKAWESSRQGATVVCLLPCRTNTNWWHDYVMKGEVRFIRGCPKFGDAKRGLWLPLAVVVFRPVDQPKGEQ